MFLQKKNMDCSLKDSLFMAAMRSYLILLIMILTLSVVTSVALGFFAMVVEAVSPDAHDKYLTILEEVSESSMNLIEVTLGTIIGALVATSQGTGNTGENHFEPGTIHNEPVVPGLPDNHKSGGNVQLQDDGNNEDESSRRQEHKVETEEDIENYVFHSLYSVRLFMIVLVAVFCAASIAFAVFGYYSSAVDSTHFSSHSTYESVFIAFETICNGFVNAIDMVVGGIIGALSATLSHSLS